jgi:hypothetical protein
VIVQRAATTLSLSSSSSPALLDQLIQLTAVVDVLSPGGGQPSGSVTFTVNGGQGVSMPLENGQAKLDLVSLPTGSHTVVAAYTGSGSFSASPTATFTQWVHYPIPTIHAIEPNSAYEDSPGFTLILEGEAFVDGTVIRWNGIALPSDLIDSNTMIVAVAASLLEDPGEAQITAANPAPGGGESGAAIFTVRERMRLYLPVAVWLP